MAMAMAMAMATHPVEPEEPMEPGTNPGAPNPTRLPVEPEFGPMEPPVEPEDPNPAHHQPPT